MTTKTTTTTTDPSSPVRSPRSPRLPWLQRRPRSILKRPRPRPPPLSLSRATAKEADGHMFGMSNILIVVSPSPSATVADENLKSSGWGKEGWDDDDGGEGLIESGVGRKIVVVSPNPESGGVEGSGREGFQSGIGRLWLEEGESESESDNEDDDDEGVDEEDSGDDDADADEAEQQGAYPQPPGLLLSSMSTSFYRYNPASPTSLRSSDSFPVSPTSLSSTSLSLFEAHMHAAGSFPEAEDEAIPLTSTMPVPMPLSESIPEPVLKATVIDATDTTTSLPPSYTHTTHTSSPPAELVPSSVSESESVESLLTTTTAPTGKNAEGGVGTPLREAFWDSLSLDVDSDEDGDGDGGKGNGWGIPYAVKEPVILDQPPVSWMKKGMKMRTKKKEEVGEKATITEDTVGVGGTVGGGVGSASKGPKDNVQLNPDVPEDVSVSSFSSDADADDLNIVISPQSRNASSSSLQASTCPKPQLHVEPDVSKNMDIFSPGADVDDLNIVTSSSPRKLNASSASPLEVSPCPQSLLKPLIDPKLSRPVIYGRIGTVDGDVRLWTESESEDAIGLGEGLGKEEVKRGIERGETMSNWNLSSISMPTPTSTSTSTSTSISTRLGLGAEMGSGSGNGGVDVGGRGGGVNNSRVKRHNGRATTLPLQVSQSTTTTTGATQTQICTPTESEWISWKSEFSASSRISRFSEAGSTAMGSGHSKDVDDEVDAWMGYGTTPTSITIQVPIPRRPETKATFLDISSTTISAQALPKTPPTTTFVVSPTPWPITEFGTSLMLRDRLPTFGSRMSTMGVGEDMGMGLGVDMVVEHMGTS